MGPLCPQGRFPLSRVEIISSKPLPARGLMGPSLPVVPAPPRLASGCQVRGRRLLPGVSLTAAGALLGSLCAAPDALARRLLPVPCRPAAAGPGDDGLLFRIVKPSYRCTPAAALPWPLRSEGWHGPGVALRSRPWREPVSHGRHPPFTTRICWVEISLVC